MQRVGWAIVGMLSVSLGVAAYAMFESDHSEDAYTRADRVLSACRDAFPDRDCTGGELPDGQFAWIAAPSAARVGFRRADQTLAPAAPPSVPPAPVTPAK